MMNLKVDEATFKSERSVVEEEYRQRVLAAPYGRLFDVAFVAASYLQHPYKRPGIGSIEDLEAATLADVVAFHKRYYRPDNATLVVTGDFDPPQLDAWVDKYFGAIPRPAEPLPQLDASEPPWTSDRASRSPVRRCRCRRSRSPGWHRRSTAPMRRRCRSPPRSSPQASRRA